MEYLMHKVYFTPDELEAEWFRVGGVIEFEGNEAVLVVDGVEHRAVLSEAS